ncbi:MAG: amidohydrolase family protein [Thermoguttaceae bacterium]|nr:amidohydrolase family protein [Thermoguttaceae bacterium]MDW8077441.1 amidohydrolase family protein [Thermoguttaceae bacterium]
MHKSVGPTAIRARWIVPVDQPPIEDGVVLISQKRILSVGKYAKLRSHLPRASSYIDFGDASVLPGLINAHTHLELSDCPVPIPAQGHSFATWIEAVIAQRRARGGHSPAVVKQGLAECLRFGITAVGDIAQWGCAPSDYCLTVAGQQEGQPTDILPGQPGGPDSATTGHSREGGKTTPSDHPPGIIPKGIAFLECISPLAEKADELSRRIDEFSAFSWPKGLKPGIAPHAPYTVHVDILRQLVDLACARKLPVAFHLAESSEEIELLQTESGPLRELLEKRGLWSANLTGGLTAGDYLRLLAKTPRVLIIHGNLLSEGDVDFLATQEHMFIVHCPRSFSHFGWGRFPLAELLARGVRLAIGTDSRASTPDLNLMAELCHVFQKYPEVPPAKLVALVTIEPAEALGIGDQVGTLTPGKAADLVVYPLPPEEKQTPFGFLTVTEPDPLAVWFDGIPVRRVVR